MFWKEGSGKGRSPVAARVPPWVRGTRAAASSSFGPAALPGVALSPQPSRGCGPPRSTLPSWTDEDTSVHARGRDRSPEERRTRHITAAVMRLHSLQVCASSHATRPGCFSAPPLSHTHSRREPGEGRRFKDGEMLIIRGEAADSSHFPPQATSPASGRHPHRSATLHQPGSSGRSGRAGIPLRATLPLAPRRDRETGFSRQPSTNHRVNDNKRNVTYPLGGWEAVSVVPPSQCRFP